MGNRGDKDGMVAEWPCRTAVIGCGDAPHEPAEPPGCPAASLVPAALG